MEKRQIIFILFAVFSVAFSSCKKDKNLADYVSEIEGTYNGTLTTHMPNVPIELSELSEQFSSTLIKSSGTIINLEESAINSFTGKPIHLDGINVSKSGNIYNLSWSTEFEGNVDGNKLTWTWDLGSGIVETFSGTKSFNNAMIPSLSTTDVTNISTVSAITGGNITNDGGGPITARGIC